LLGESCDTQVSDPALQFFATQVLVAGFWHCCPELQQTLPHGIEQHFPLMHCCPGLQHVPPHVGAEKLQQRLALASAHLDRLSQHASPHAEFLGQHFLLPTQTSLGPQQSVPHVSCAGGQQVTPFLHTSPFLQQTLLQST
jgi:hypothetical protein